MQYVKVHIAINIFAIKRQATVVRGMQLFVGFIDI